VREMEERFVGAVETAIAKLVADFQSHSARFWNDRDMHWGLFYHPKEEGGIPETNVT